MDRHSNRISQVENSVAPRSAILQERSRQRQKSLLDAAESLIAEVGLDGLAMRELGRRAGLPIASVYHYYPSASAVLHALATRQLQAIQARVRAKLAAPPLGDMTATVAVGDLAFRLIDDIAEYMASSPATAAIWNAMRSNPQLRTLDRADTLEGARDISPYLALLLPAVPRANLEAISAVILEAVSINLVSALELPAEARTLRIAGLKTFVAAALNGFTGGIAARP